jgi:transforming growth factor-beta-induced protein
LAGEFFAKDLSDGLIADTLNGESVVITLLPVAVNGNAVVDADNDVSNGVVHILQGILTPSWVFNSLTDRAVVDRDLSTLVALVTIAGIDLTVPGELTLLAPTNEAFTKLPTEVVEFLLSSEGKETLVSVLTHHVLVGVYTSSELEDGAELTSLEGRAVTVSIVENVMFNNAAVVAVDILANNGVLYKIDEVLAFPDGTIIDFVGGNPDLTALTFAVVRAGLVDALNSRGPLTLFAPNNDAFGAVPEFLLELLLTNDEFIPHVRSTHDEIRFDCAL